MSRVLVTVYGGVAEVYIEDQDTQVLVVDYDIDGCKNVDKDAQGIGCIVGHNFGPAPAMVSKYFDHFKPKGE